MNEKLVAFLPRTVGLAAAVACLTLGTSVQAADNDTQTVNFTVSAINEIDIDNAAVSLNVNSATAGSAPSPANAASSYAITTNAATDGKKITAAINTAMPSNVTLSVNVSAPSGGSTSAGPVALGTGAVDVVNDIEGVAASGVAINYTLTAAVTAPPTSGSKTVTYTIADEI